MFLELCHLFDRVNAMTDDPAMQETAILLI